MSNPRLSNIARWTGILSSAIVLILWLVLVAAKQSQYDPRAMPENTWTIGKWILDAVDAKMIVLALAGILAALFKNPFLMILVFLLMFIPVGLYLLGVPGWARWISVANLIFLCASFLILSTRYRILKI